MKNLINDGFCEHCLKFINFSGHRKDCPNYQGVRYRYENRLDVVLLEEYPIVKRTPCGAWINVYGKQRFVLEKDSLNCQTRKRFAYATVEEARVSFFARKRRQLLILRAQLESVEGAIKALEEGRIADYSGLAFNHDY